MPWGKPIFVCLCWRLHIKHSVAILHDMPCCPSCSRGGFADHEAVARHMSQPRSGCSNWSDILIHLQEDMFATQIQDSMMAIYKPRTTQEHLDLSIDDGIVEGPWGDKSQLPDQSSTTVYFNGATCIFGVGKTFLNKFNNDLFNSYWELNIYYPFASCGDWELGSWLLCSSLSMIMINSLLSLELVHLFVLTCQICLLTHGFRWKVYPSPFKQQVSSANWLDLLQFCSLSVLCS